MAVGGLQRTERGLTEVEGVAGVGAERCVTLPRAQGGLGRKLWSEGHGAAPWKGRGRAPGGLVSTTVPWPLATP